MKRFIFLLGALLMPHHLLASDKLLVHYSRLAGDHAGWNLWTWNDEDRQPGFDLLPAGRDAFGVVYELDLAASGLKGKRLGLLPRRARQAAGFGAAGACLPAGGGQTDLLRPAGDLHGDHRRLPRQFRGSSGYLYPAARQGLPGAPGFLPDPRRERLSPSQGRAGGR